ncbi:MAG TPA: hypothetical protein VMT15_10000 [Bryobacteraceae bacterium]|nr:hypothetical protein [Bryobacteraceae bacterium]
MQQFRQSNSIPILTRAGREGNVTLVNLNPSINVWYLLKLAWRDSNVEADYHLENPAPHTRKLVLDDKNSSGLVILEGINRIPCDLFGSMDFEKAKSSPLIYYPLCEGRIYLRKSATGQRTTLEATTEFLREHVWGGEKIIDVGHIILGDSQREIGKIQSGAQTGAKAREPVDIPLPALIDSKYANQFLTSYNLGIALEEPDQNGMVPGTWHAARGNPGVYVSVLQPNFIDPAILQSYRTAANNLDSVEAASLCYLIAFDLDRFELAFALGTDYPGVGWSRQVPEQRRDPNLPGPDGFENIQPLVATGLISPDEAGKTVATFTGGFKRSHGAFKYGDLALRNHGSHYGFMEKGVVFSTLQPGLATIFVLDDGVVEMKTWADSDNKLLPRIKCARQNGVPLIEFDGPSRAPVPGPLVARWGPGNWSGSQNSELRTMRSGVALQKSQGRRFLIYAVFSDATPSAMARAFQAYRCEYAMLLDMNALEHTYAAVYRRSGSQLVVDHLLKGMSVLDKSASGELSPRFLGYADNRDFFYLMRRNGKEVKP